MDPGERHPGETVIYEGHPSWRGILSFYVKGIGIALVIAALIGLVTRIAGDSVSWPGAGGAFAVIVGLVILIGLVKRLATSYTVTSHRLRIRQGILSKNVKETRLERVQNVNTHQSFVDRILRVGKVDFDTAGTDDYEFAFVGIADPAGIAHKVDKAVHEDEQREDRAVGQQL